MKENRKENIEETDKNLKVPDSINEENVIFYDVKTEPFKVYGLYDYTKESVFKRLPDDIARSVNNEGIRRLYRNTAGGRVRFATDSRYVAIKAAMPEVTTFPHMPLTGTSGFDLYIDENGGSLYYKTFVPPYGMKNGYESVAYFPEAKERMLTVNFPLYNNVDSLYIGIESTASLSEGAQYQYGRPVLYYGSSITQGGCASRPGNSYPSIISRELDCDFINFGFSGSAKGDKEIIEHISQMDIGIFVCDFDHNAVDANELLLTHEKIYSMFRENNDSTPVIFISRPDFESDIEDSIRRRGIIYATYANAVKGGDKNVYFIDGEKLFEGECRDCCTVDGTHPNDMGFFRMAQIIGNKIKEIIN